MRDACEMFVAVRLFQKTPIKEYMNSRNCGHSDNACDDRIRANIRGQAKHTPIANNRSSYVIWVEHSLTTTDTRTHNKTRRSAFSDRANLPKMAYSGTFTRIDRMCVRHARTFVRLFLPILSATGLSTYKEPIRTHTLTHARTHHLAAFCCSVQWHIHGNIFAYVRIFTFTVAGPVRSRRRSRLGDDDDHQQSRASRHHRITTHTSMRARVAIRLCGAHY